MNKPTVTLREALAYEPRELAFGTSGLRGRVADITSLEAWINTTGFLRWLSDTGALRAGDGVYLASDLRPSSDALVPEQEGRGEIAQAVARAVIDAACSVRYLGKIPTPALTAFAMAQRCASIMVTGSHIPFDRNGIKFNRIDGEVLKTDEAGILEAVARVRREVYQGPFQAALFDARGMLRPEARRALPDVDGRGRDAYQQRYLNFFAGQSLEGRRIMVYQHSALARDLLVDLLEALGAEVVAAGRSETFVPIDTEDIGAEQLRTLQRLVDEVPGPLDAVVSTDGDSDRPLVVSVAHDPQGQRCVRFHSGDLLGIVVARYLDADAVAVPVSANDAVERVLGDRVLPRTRIGSPHVIAAMRAAVGKRRVVGFEANGGFLVGSDLTRPVGTRSSVSLRGTAVDSTLRALPTRDAVLPILATLFAASDLAWDAETHFSVGRLFDTLPPRATRAGLVDDFPVEASRRVVARLSPSDPDVRQVTFVGDGVQVEGADGRVGPAAEAEAQRLRRIRADMTDFFPAVAGFGDLTGVNYVDGVRMFFANGDVAHIRASGNAPQLRLYACADTQDRADAIVRLAVAEPEGILRRLAR